MPTYYEGAPIVNFENEISEEQYVRAWEVYQTRKGVLRGREIKCFFLFAAAALIAIWIPVYRSHFTTFWLPVCGIVICLVLCGYYLFLMPRAVKSHAQEVFRSNRLLGLPDRVEIYRDSFLVQNEYESLSGHWTDFSECLETPGLFVLLQGWDRTLLVIDKEDLPPEKIAVLSGHFSSVYVNKDHQLKK